MERSERWSDDRHRSDHRPGEARAATSIGAMLGELLAALPTIRSVAAYRDEDVWAGQRALGRGGRAPRPDADGGFVVTRALLGLARSRDSADPDGRQCAIIRRARAYQLLLPMRGGCLSFEFGDVPMNPEAAVRRVVDVLTRHGMDTLWVSG
jgi:hypothetical protein